MMHALRAVERLGDDGQFVKQGGVVTQRRAQALPLAGHPGCQHRHGSHAAHARRQPGRVEAQVFSPCQAWGTERFGTQLAQ
jgi:hypothetical protein